MNRVKNADHDFLKLEDETGLSLSRSLDAAVPRADAVRLLHAGEVCGDGGNTAFIAKEVRLATLEAYPWLQDRQLDTWRATP